MQYALIPRTEIQVSRLCLGTMTFGTPVPEAEALRLVAAARDQYGINFIDTANMYEGYARAPGSAGGVKLYDVSEREAAMLMAIVADKTGKPLNELRFISIKEVK